MKIAAIDVLLPVYNAADTLNDSLESLAEQDFGDFRVIAIDDGSTDHSGALLKAWAARDKRFTVLTRPNGGIVHALNAGLAEVTAPLVARMDGDDLCNVDRFSQQRAYLEAHPDCVAVGCGVDHIDGNGRQLRGFPQPGPPEEANAVSMPAREPYIVHPFLMARTETLRAVGGYRRVPHSEDSDLFWRLADHGRLHNLPMHLGKYRMHMDSISGSSVINGRVMAVGSQLGAVSAQRRSANKPDLCFDRNLVAELRAARELEQMCAVVAPMLEQRSEMPFFRLAAGMKLLELANYRPYEIEASDCTFIADALEPVYWSATEANQREIDFYLTRTGSRLMRRGRLRDATTLAPKRLWRWTGIKTLLFR